MEPWLFNMDFALWQKFALAALIGLMVGLEREHSHQQSETSHFAGIRTFPLMALLGCTAALLSG
ncbi:MAG: MgtC/SapB family protein, partial [Anaerolineae bacterium]